MNDSISRQHFIDGLSTEKRPPLALLPAHFHRWDCITRSGILLCSAEIGHQRVNLLPDGPDTELIEQQLPELMTWTFWFPASDVGLVFVQAYDASWPKGSISGSSSLSIQIEANYHFPANLADVPLGGLKGAVEYPNHGDAYTRHWRIQQPVFKVPFVFEEHSYACSLPAIAPAHKHYLWLR